MTGRSKVEKSANFTEIMDMIKQGFSPRKISEYLKDEYNEVISHVAINNFKKKINKKISNEYHEQRKENNRYIVQEEIEKKETVDKVVDDTVSGINALDNIILDNNKIKLKVEELEPEVHTDYVVTTPVDIEKVKIQAQNTLIRAVDIKSKILKDDPNPDINIFNIGFDEDELEYIKAQARSQAKSSVFEQ